MAADDLLLFHPSDALRPASRWSWRTQFARVAPSDATLTAYGFAGSKWAPHLPRTEGNLLLLLHGLGDGPAAFAQFAARLALPQTSSLALNAPLPLPLDLPGRMWHDSFAADGSLLDGTDRRRAASLARETRRRLLALLRLLERGCGWSRERIFLFGFAQGGTAVLDLLGHLEPSSEDGGRLGGVISWCGLPLPELLQPLDSKPPPRAAAAAAATPLLVVAGGAADAEPPPHVAERFYEQLVSKWSPRDGRSCARDDAEAATTSSLHTLAGHRGAAMVGSPSEARLLMEFFARHLALDCALQDDPSIVRVS